MEQHTVYPVYWEWQEEIVIEALNLGADRYFNKFGKTETVYNEFHLAQTFISENNVELCNRSDASVEKFTELSTIKTVFMHAQGVETDG